MKILSVSDTVSPELMEKHHGGPYLSDIELIFSCGDLPPEFLVALKHRYDVPLLYVLGNHDIRYQSAPPGGCLLIDRKLEKVRGLKIIGFSGSRWYNGGPNQYTEKEMARHIRRMWFPIWRNGTPDIIISHAPPRYIHDGKDRCHKGFKSFVTLMKKYKPAVLIHGHIHRSFTSDAERITIVNSTRVINSYGFYVLEI